MKNRFSLLVVLTLLLGACAGESLSEEPSEETVPPETVAPVETLSPSELMMELALIALEDNGESGPLVGCGDSVVSVFQEGLASGNVTTRVQKAVSALLAIDEEYHGESGLYNALSLSDLYVTLVEYVNDTLTVSLEGTLLSGGMCDDPRIKEQLLETILSNSELPAGTPVEIFVNWENLDTLLNGKGE